MSGSNVKMYLYYVPSGLYCSTWNQLDWIKKEDARAAIRLAIKKELRGKVPFSELDNLLKEVIEQAEGQYRVWPLEA